MKSWDALEEITDELKYVCNDGIQLAKYDERRILAIQKDLMILEILKKTLNNSFLCLIKNKEEQEKVKEWLNGK